MSPQISQLSLVIAYETKFRESGYNEWATGVAYMASRSKLKLFGLGLGVRLLGVALIWLGDSHDSLFRKSLVVIGVVLTIGGITVLRYMLWSPLLSKFSDGRSAPIDR